jgi:hypothetical protein
MRARGALQQKQCAWRGAKEYRKKKEKKIAHACNIGEHQQGIPKEKKNDSTRVQHRQAPNERINMGAALTSAIIQVIRAKDEARKKTQKCRVNKRIRVQREWAALINAATTANGVRKLQSASPSASAIEPDLWAQEHDECRGQ